MRLVHLAIENRTGRLITRKLKNTRISGGRWDPVPVPPDAAAALITPIPLLVVHGERDDYFPVDHGQRIFSAAGEPKELWIEPGMGHAESGSGPELINRIGAWIRASVGLGAAAEGGGDAVAPDLAPTP